MGNGRSPYPRERPCTDCTRIEGRVGPRNGLDSRGKYRTHRDSFSCLCRELNYFFLVSCERSGSTNATCDIKQMSVQT
jgi:hypothetical protein